MRNNFARAILAGLLTAALSLFIPAGATAQPVTAGKSVCETGGRHMAEYRRLCMTRGTVADAARDYYAVPVGRKGREERDGWNRRSVCKFAHEYGGIRKAARELWLDGSYDSYLRYEHVLKWVGTFAAHDCRAMGYRV